VQNILRLGLRSIVYTLIFLVVLSSSANSQSLEWTKLLGSTSGEDGQDVAVDSFGNIYITGGTDGNLGGETNAGGIDMFLGKYDPSGRLLWVKLLGTASHEYSFGVTVDINDNIYVTGNTNGNLGGEINAGGADMFLAKYNGSGTLLWIKLLGTVSSDSGTSVITDSSGNIYVTGCTDGGMLLVKYNESGTLLWIKLLGDDSYLGRDINVDLSGNIYVSGTRLINGEYDGAGSLLWDRFLGGTELDINYGNAIDKSGNLYVTGITIGDLGGEINAGGCDMFLAKYNESGTLLWLKLLGTESFESGRGVTVGMDGNIYVTGYTSGNLGGQTNAGDFDVFIAKYTDAGTLMWVKLYGSALDEYVGKITSDKSGNIFITGRTRGSFGSETNSGLFDVFLMKYMFESDDFPWELFYPAFIKKR
jgi:hypothetical protein